MKPRCTKCDVPYVIGYAIETDRCGGFCTYPSRYNYDSLRLINCWKCPKCGESEELDNEDKMLLNGYWRCSIK